jgi:hypothetical protein
VCGTGVGVPRSAAPGDAAPTLRVLEYRESRVSRLYFSGSPDPPPLPINWRWVEDEAESTCSQVTAAERLLHKTLASIHRNILHPIRVSLKRETKPCPHSHGLLHAFSFLLCFISTTLFSGRHRCACVVGRGDSGMGNSNCYGCLLCYSNARRKDFCLGGYCRAR